MRQGIIPDLSQIIHLELADHFHARAGDDVVPLASPLQPTTTTTIDEPAASRAGQSETEFLA